MRTLFLNIVEYTDCQGHCYKLVANKAMRSSEMGGYLWYGRWLRRHAAMSTSCTVENLWLLTPFRQECTGAGERLEDIQAIRRGSVGTTEYIWWYRRNRGRLSAVSAGAYTTTLLMMEVRVKGEGCAPFTLTRLGWFYHHNGMRDCGKGNLQLPRAMESSLIPKPEPLNFKEHENQFRQHI